MRLSLQESDLNFTVVFQAFQQLMCSVLLLPEVTVSRDFEVEGSLQYQMICGANKIHGVDKSLAG